MTVLHSDPGAPAGTLSVRDHMRRLFAHMFWADRRVLELLDTTPAARLEEVTRLFSHVLAAERVWLLRLRGRDGSIQPIWPVWSLEELNAVAAASRAGYGRLLEELNEEGLGQVVEYANSRGTPFRTRAVDILGHVALHGSYHRGQVAAALRRGGADPVDTDYITYVREMGGARRCNSS